MAKNKDDIKYATAQARLTEDDATRVAYKGGTPLEGGKIAESETVDLFSAAHNVENAQSQGAGGPNSAQPQLNRDENEADQGGAGTHPNFSSRRLPKKQ
ncbi:SEED MATURATION PROTEIN 1 [Amaranthus tricolor]|uniref:SEED MATURATION PROTEIN 1 n=1 Tax=Amaranthus tricolor TaxID=29722 RepID=UPI00258BBF39|nr:SEED MATURATION PROTEIN 1 [Amaranthus tricolor]